MQGEDGASPRAASGTNAPIADDAPTVEPGNEPFPGWHSVPDGQRPSERTEHPAEHQTICAVDDVSRRADATAVEPCTDRVLKRVREALVALLRDADEMVRLHRSAEIAARVPRGSLLAQEIVADVVADTYEGILTWNAESTFATHLMDEVRRRGNQMRWHARKHVPLAELREVATPLVDHEGAEAEPDAAQLQERAAWAREQVGDDPATLQLLTLYELGIRRRRDVLSLGMPRQAYRRARKRLMAIFGREESASVRFTRR